MYSQGDQSRNNKRTAEPSSVHHRQRDEASRSARGRRPRTSIACNTCRMRKSKCDGGQPFCQMCVDYGYDCVYNVPSDDNKTIVNRNSLSVFEGRLHALEETLANMMAESTIMPGILPSQESRIMTAFNPVDSENVILGESGGEDETKLEVIEDVIDGMGAITFEDEEASSYFGPTSNIAFVKHISHALLSLDRISGKVRLDSSEAHSYGLVMSRPQSPSQKLSAINPYGLSASMPTGSLLPPEPEISRLVTLFFSGIGVMFPYIDEISFWETYKKAVETQFKGIRRSWLCLLYMVLTFASSQTPTNGVSAGESLMEPERYLWKAWVISCSIKFRTMNLEFNVSNTFFQEDGTKLNESMVDRLLLAYYLQGTRCSAQTWGMHSLVIEAAYQLGLHSSNHNAKYTLAERVIRQKLWYGCIALDRTLSMTFGRPPSIANAYVCEDVIKPISNSNENGLPGSMTTITTSANKLAGVFLLENCNTLYLILGDIISDIYGQNLDNINLEISVLLAKTLELEQRLVKWKQQLPPPLQILTVELPLPETDNQMTTELLNVILTMRFHNIRSLLHRPVLMKFLDHISGRVEDDIEYEFLNQFGKKHLEMCISSAVDTITLIYKAGPKVLWLLVSWWAGFFTFNASLTIFGNMIMHANPKCTSGDSAATELLRLYGVLQMAAETLKNLEDCKLGRRCGKYLNRLIWAIEPVVFSYDTEDRNRASDATQLEPMYGRLASMSPLNRDSWSPMGVDFGEFLAVGNMEFLNEVQNVGQQSNWRSTS